jgi:hypothetical protein
MGASGEHLVEDRAEREEIGPRVGGPALGLLGRHVGWSPDDRTSLGEPESLSLVAGRGAVGALFRESEIKQLDHPILGDEDVRRLEVAMDDALEVRRLERRCNLDCQPQRFAGRERARFFGGDDRRAVDALHDQVARADIVDLADVGVVECRDCLGFPLEPFAELRGGYFDRDVAIQARVSGSIHFTHAARAEGR